MYTVPASSQPACRPRMVTVPTSVLRKTWRITTVRGGRPLARAVRTYNWPSTSSTLARVSRAITASGTTARRDRRQDQVQQQVADVAAARRREHAGGRQPAQTQA